MTITEARPVPRAPRVREILCKVPEVTIFFWIIKIMATTVGETAADLLNDKLHLGLTNTTYIMGALLVAALVFQFKARKYEPGIYWLAVVLISVVGTLITDNLTDHFGVKLETTTIVFAVALVAVFVAWYMSEKTLSIHSVFTAKREAFYWSAILFTFALGTAAGDLVAERMNLGYWTSALLFAALIGVVTVVHYGLKRRSSTTLGRHTSNAVVAFWAAYILTRPLGASLGDYLSQPRHDGGLGLGTVGTSVLFLVTILFVVSYLTKTRRDANPLTRA